MPIARGRNGDGAEYTTPRQNIFVWTEQGPADVEIVDYH